MKQLITWSSLLLLLTIPPQKKAFAQVKIGTQIWMAQNLNVSNFRNGDIIPEAKSDEDWEKAGIEERPAWCYYNGDAGNGKKYGKLYNWYAVNDPRGLAPEGWHIPGKDEWELLDSYLGSLDFQVIGIVSYTGQRMKAMSGWNKKGNGNNKSKFNALPGGFRFINGVFLNVGDEGWWWTSTAFDIPDEEDYAYGAEKGKYEDDIHSAWFFILKNSEDGLYTKYAVNEYGFSVRCIKDSEISAVVKKVDNKIVTGKFTDPRDGGGTYHTIKINNQTWMSENLDVSAFRNGDIIPEVRTAEAWQKAGEEKKPAWCYYDNDHKNEDYGKLYNWYAVNDLRGLAPEGWHIPVDNEWTKLTNFLGAETAKKMKSSEAWKTPGKENRFAGLPGGCRLNVGTFHMLGTYAGWWSSNSSQNGAGHFSIYDNSKDPTRGDAHLASGLSVRCIKD